MTQWWSVELFVPPMAREWSQPKDAEHQLYRAVSDVRDAEGTVLVTAYALYRPDGQWALMLVNKDHDHSRPVRVVFHDSEAVTSTAAKEEKHAAIEAVSKSSLAKAEENGALEVAPEAVDETTAKLEIQQS